MNTKNRFIWLVVIVLVLALAVAIKLLLSVYISPAPSQPDFTAYKPTMLPNNIKITDQSLELTRHEGFDDWSFNYKVGFDKKDISLFEYQTTEYTSKLSCNGNDDTCTQHETPKGGKYIVHHEVYKARPYGLTIKWMKGNTYGVIFVDDAVTKQYLSYDWDEMIDSLKPVELKNMPFETRVVRNQGI